MRDAAERTETGAGTVATAGEAFERIDEAVAGLVDRVRRIAAAGRAVAEETDAVRTRMDEAARLTETSSANTEEVSATTEQTAEAARAMAGSAARLGDAADRARGPRRAVHRFRQPDALWALRRACQNRWHDYAC